MAADPILNYRDIRFDAQGRPFYLTQSGRQSYMPPSQAAQAAGLFITDPSQRAAVLASAGFSPDTVAKLTAYAQSGGVTAQNPTGSVPDATFAKSRGEWNPQTGQYDQHMGSSLKGAIIGGSALGGIAAASALAGAAGGGAAGSTVAPGVVNLATPASTAAAAPIAPAAAAAGTHAATAAAPSFASRLSSLVHDPKKLISLAALIPSLARSLGGGGNGSGFGSGDLGGIGDEITKNLAMQRERMQQAQPAFDALVQQAYGQTPSAYRGQAPAGSTPAQAPSGAYAYQAPRFGGR